MKKGHDMIKKFTVSEIGNLNGPLVLWYCLQHSPAPIKVNPSWITDIDDYWLEIGFCDVTH